VGERDWIFPVEAIHGSPPHDGIATSAESMKVRHFPGTLVLACCDPSASQMAAAFTGSTGIRMLVFNRGGKAALELLKAGKIHLAGLHFSTIESPDKNLREAKRGVGGNIGLIRSAQWETGLVQRCGTPKTLADVVKTTKRWALREPGSAARECADRLAPSLQTRGRVFSSHSHVALAVRHGWSDAGVCVRICAEEEGLSFSLIRKEYLDFCFWEHQSGDLRLQAFFSFLKSRKHHEWVSEIPGYSASQTGERVS